MKRFAGSKWLNEVSYITEEERAEALKLVAEAKTAGCERVGVRPGSYIGANSPLIVVTYNGHSKVYGRVSKIERAA